MSNSIIDLTTDEGQEEAKEYIKQTIEKNDNTNLITDEEKNKIHEQNTDTIIGGVEVTEDTDNFTLTGSTGIALTVDETKSLSDKLNKSDISNWAKSSSLSEENVPNLDVSKITSGIFGIERLPDRSLTKLYFVSDEYNRFLLTIEDVQNGDTVKQIDTGLMYYVVDDTNLDNSSGYTSYSAGTASSVVWSSIIDKPTEFTPMTHSLTGSTHTTATLAQLNSKISDGNLIDTNDSRLSNSRPASDVHPWAKSSSLAEENVPNLDASKITTGVFDIDRIPHGALERLFIVANETARFALTIEEVQNGNTVKETDTGLMYYVIDDTNLDNSSGYEVYTAGSASSVPWSGVTDKPTEFTPMTHTHDDKVDKITDYSLVADTEIAKIHVQNTDTNLSELSTKDLPTDTDKVVHRNSETSDSLVTSTWAQIKSFFKTYFDTIYDSIGSASGVQSNLTSHENNTTDAHGIDEKVSSYEIGSTFTKVDAIVRCTQVEYDAIVSPDDNTLYIIEESV